jgi:hypothetical protein
VWILVRISVPSESFVEFRGQSFVGNETMEGAKESGQLEGWNQILNKRAAVLTELAQTN